MPALICLGKTYHLSIGDVVEFNREFLATRPNHPRSAVVIGIYPDGDEHIMVTFEARSYPSDFYIPHDIREARGNRQWSMSICGLYQSWNVVGKVTPENRAPCDPYTLDSFGVRHRRRAHDEETARRLIEQSHPKPLPQFQDPGPKVGDKLLYDGGMERDLDEIDRIRIRNRMKAAAKKASEKPKPTHLPSDGTRRN